ncbi:hypothetical protein EUGRSUZ_I00331 [Eucalyptus grandis]|uniref:Uncharacterized protein n=2 Tax=Eucalyptus grandis TaxID=71139 RepID=A0ACC3JBF2_EUCGR|nr:hypothetical protein EUGRSUZ_I00331 [Eucalyptus grandis]
MSNNWKYMGLHGIRSILLLSLQIAFTYLDRWTFLLDFPEFCMLNIQQSMNTDLSSPCPSLIRFNLVIQARAYHLRKH